MPKNRDKLEVFTPTSFENAVFVNKRRLVILDNLVLDLGSDMKGYAIHHPGGKFILERNIGRDISKFFFGGYSMIKDQKMVIHSAMALAICDKMVVGYLKDQEQVTYTPAVSESSHTVNKLTKTVRLTT